MSLRSDPRARGPRTLLLVATGAAFFVAGRYSHSLITGSATDAPPAPALRAERPAAHDDAPAADAVNAARTEGPWSDSAWRDMHALRATPRRDELLANLLETLATTEPARALALAQADPNRLLRDRLIVATLRGWARTSLVDAGRWAAVQSDPALHETALNAVFAGAAAADPDAAVRGTATLMAENPGDAVGYGGHLIDALCEGGRFETAARFAASGDPNQKSFWLGAAFSKWASFQPEQAAQAAALLEEGTTRSTALHGVIGGWSDANPGAAVQFVAQLSDGADKSSLMSQALLRWTKVDLKTASDWINSHEMGPAMDEGISAVATRDYMKPDVAVSWAESVINPKLRSETLVGVLRRWATTDLAGAKHYYETTTHLTAEDRQEIAGLIATLSDPSAGQVSATEPRS